ncbi:MAG: hypothetical protein KDB61_09680, partial [Planctomycetes bacterium]|nr:hypothetical protein [Planctomycetota bacterium]
RFSPDPHLGGVRTIKLEQGGALDLEIRKQGIRQGAALRIRDLDLEPGMHPLVFEVKDYADQMRIAGLPIGHYAVSSEEPIRPANMPVFGRAEFRIVNGEGTRCELVLAAEPTFTAVSVAGYVRIPGGWGPVKDWTVRFERLDPYGSWGRDYSVPGTEFEPLEAQPDLYRWGVDSMAPGAYCVRYEPTSYVEYLEVHGAGADSIQLALPKPRTVRLRFVDGRTGESCTPQGLFWSALEPPMDDPKWAGSAALQSTRIPLHPIEDGVPFEFRAPDAPLRIQIEDGRWAVQEWSFSNPGDQDQTIELTPR